jgi:sarcosine oxidase subunit gamma
MKSEATLEYCSPFDGLPVPHAAGNGVEVAYRNRLSLTTACTHQRRAFLLAQRVREHFGIQLPLGPRLTGTGPIRIAGIGPCAWLLMREGSDEPLIDSLQHALGACAALTDVTDAYAVLRLSGPKVRETLAKLVPVDLHARTFKAGDCASTVAVQIDVVLWRLEDRVGAAVFEVAVPRSFCGSFWQSLCESSAEFGLSVRSY